MCENAVQIGRENNADPKLIARAFARMGNAFAKQDRYIDAMASYHESLQEHDSEEVLAKADDVRKVLEDREVLAKHEFVIGKIRLRAGAFHEAVTHFTESINLHEMNPLPYKWRAVSYAHLMEIELAMVDFRDAVLREMAYNETQQALHAFP